MGSKFDTANYLGPIGTSCLPSDAWLRFPERMRPSTFIRFAKLRCGLLSTPARLVRGRAPAPPCRAGCAQPATLGHILQKCSHTHDARCRRHNEVMNAIAQQVQSPHTEVMVEPIVPHGSTFMKPDLIIVRGSVAYVADVTISSPTNVEPAYANKVEKYGNPEALASIKLYLSSRYPTVTDVKQTPVVITSNGLLHRKSDKILENLGLRKHHRASLCYKAMLGSLVCYDIYMRGIPERSTPIVDNSDGVGPLQSSFPHFSSFIL